MADEAALERHRTAVRVRLRAASMTRPGPGSVSWQINREIVVVAAWGRAILLQLAHPLVAAGVDAHSGFRASLPASLARLRSTVGAMLSLTFGGDDDAIATAARINRIHDHVFGHLEQAAGAFPAGATYSAHDADLLCWVHTTLLDSMPRVYEQLVGPLTPEQRDRYCAESAVMEPLLDIPSGLLPRSAAAVDAHMRDVLAGGRLTVTDGSRAMGRAVLFPPRWRCFWPAFRPVQLLSIGLLPEPIRHAYGFAWTRSDARALARWTMALRMLHRVMPAVVTTWPSSRRRGGAAPGSSASAETVTHA